MLREQEMKEWQYHNSILQTVYQKYLGAHKEKDKEQAILLIKEALSWQPFEYYCHKSDAAITGSMRYGLDYITEQCIKEIDEIARGEKDFEL